MNYNWRFSIPETKYTASNPYEQTKKVTHGRIRHVAISNPAGSVGKSHLQIFFHEFQVYPLNKGQWYEGEKIKVDFDDDYPLYSAPYELKFKGYNESSQYAHAFYINVTILREEGELPGEVGKDLVGLVGEV